MQKKLERKQPRLKEANAFKAECMLKQECAGRSAGAVAGRGILIRDSNDTEVFKGFVAVAVVACLEPTLCLSDRLCGNTRHNTVRKERRAPFILLSPLSFHYCPVQPKCPQCESHVNKEGVGCAKEGRQHSGMENSMGKAEGGPEC